MKRLSICVLLAIAAAFSYAQTHVSFDDTDHWTKQEFAPYVGKTITLDQPIIICNNYSGLVASMHRVMSPTNQALPLSQEYNLLVTQNNNATFYLNNLSGYHRMGEYIYGATVKISSTGSVQLISYDSITNTRAEMEAGLPCVDLVRDGDTIVRHDLLICAANLEYYLTEQFGTGSSSSMGPASLAEHQKQRTKVSAGLSKIRADIYGLVEVQLGQGALQEIAADLTRLTGRNYTYIADASNASGTFTKSGYVYCSDVVTPYGKIINNETRVQNRKKMQAFDVIGSGERFIFALNHFKAKSGSGKGADADQGDGQGTFNQSRIDEANSVLQYYQSNRGKLGDDDILIMGDLNAYAMEDPIQTLVRGGMTDLHRYFHADSSYSYTYHGQAGYLDHALCNSTMLQQVTGMAAYHLNSDESDNYTYDKSNDQTMFRYSDHDPVLVGLKMGAQFVHSNLEATIDRVSVQFNNGRPVIYDAADGYFVLVSIDGRIVTSGTISGNEFTIDTTLPQGIYALNVYANKGIKRVKYFVQ